MRTTRPLAVLGAAALLAAGPALADVVKLRSGDLVEGKARDLGEIVRVETAEGTLDLPWSRVELIDRSSTTKAVFEEKRAAVKADDAKGLFGLALWCERQGLGTEARDLYGRVVALEPAHEAARAALREEKVDGSWRKGDDLLRAKGFVRRDGNWVLREAAEASDRSAASRRALNDEEKRAVQNLEALADPNPRVRQYAAEALAAAPADLQRRVWLAGIRHRSPLVRAAAAKGLGVKGDEGVVRTLLRTSVLDTARDVRAAAVQGLREVGNAEVALPLIRSLQSASPAVRTNAAEALGALGDRVAVRTLIQRLHLTWGGTNRANIQVYNQVSYIADFDVEIAQLAQIGDPIIQQLREGVVLDAKVFSAESYETRVERQVIVESLGRLTGKNLGEDAAAWQRWWDSEGKAAMESAAVATPTK